MSVISIETSKINELTLADLVGSDDDLVIVRFADGSGVKAVKLGSLRKAMTGDISGLSTTDKESIVAAINEVDAAQKKTAEDLSPLIYANAGSHNSVFRGKFLGTSVTAAQFKAISDGTFEDLYVGDYWTMGGKNWRIAGFDIFLHTGDTELTKHHAIVLPDEILYKGQMNSTNTAAGGYYNSAMKQSGLAAALTTINSLFGSSHIITRRAMLDNAISGDDASGWAWYDSQIDLLTEEQVYGVSLWGTATHNGYRCGVDYSRLPLFNLAPEFITNREVWWLRTVGSSAYFANVNDAGDASYTGASGSWGVRPAFLIG
jgi:hypothetical protein